MSKCDQTFNPDWATHPGEHLDEYIEVSGVTFQELEERHGLDQDDLEAIIRKERPVSQPIAERLEQAFGLKAYIWTRLQRAWDRQNLDN